ncbi:hypothetical protein evm_015181 [Chilo suppressalis]|nr:hypothetical protein evm_015181 [Chilo suppressalis]
MGTTRYGTTIDAICSRAVPLNASFSEIPTGAGTPPKKPKYGPGALPSNTEYCATVCGIDTSELGGVVAAIDTHARLHVYTMPACNDMREFNDLCYYQRQTL